VTALSGNGYYLLYRVNEPNDDETKQLFKSCLEAIAAQFTTDEVDIDTKVYNASRLAKAYGSLAAKGEDTKERPHRFSKILSIPNPICVVLRSQLEKLASAVAKTSNTRHKKGAIISSDSIDKFLEWGNVTVKSVTATADGGKKWILAACPFNAEHTNSPAVFQSADGVLGFKCFHKSCGEYHWKEFRNAVEQEKGEKFRFTSENPPAHYEMTQEGIVLYTFARDGEPIQKLLRNFTARILTNVTEDDGVEKKNVLEIEARCRGRKKHFFVPASEFPKMTWPLEKFGGEAIIAAGMGAKDHARAAIQHLSGDIERRTVYTHTGWLCISPQWFYLGKCPLIVFVRQLSWEINQAMGVGNAEDKGFRRCDPMCAAKPLRLSQFEEE
jgi:hypothetical protein